jgi:hypothetical protein
VSTPRLNQLVNAYFRGTGNLSACNVALMGDVRGAYRVLVGIPEGKKPLGRPTRRRDDNTKTDIQEVGWGHGLDCSGSE